MEGEGATIFFATVATELDRVQFIDPRLGDSSSPDFGTSLALALLFIVGFPLVLAAIVLYLPGNEESSDEEKDVEKNVAHLPIQDAPIRGVYGIQKPQPAQVKSLRLRAATAAAAADIMDRIKLAKVAASKRKESVTAPDVPGTVTESLDDSLDHLQRMWVVEEGADETLRQIRRVLEVWHDFEHINMKNNNNSNNNNM